MHILNHLSFKICCWRNNERSVWSLTLYRVVIPGFIGSFLMFGKDWDPPCWTTRDQHLRLQNPLLEGNVHLNTVKTASLARRESDSCFRWHWCVISASYALQHPYQLLVLLHQPCSEKAAGLETRRWRGKVGRKSCWFLGEEVKEEKRCHGRTGKGSKLPGSAQ